MKENDWHKFLYEFEQYCIYAKLGGSTFPGWDAQYTAQEHLKKWRTK